jgi:hypothetical protein
VNRLFLFAGEFDWPAVSALRRSIAEVEQRWSKIYYVKLLRAWEATLSHWIRLHIQTLAPTNPHWSLKDQNKTKTPVLTIRKACALAVGILIG